MITSLIRSTFKYTAGSARPLVRSGLWVTRRLAAIAFGMPERRAAAPAPAESAESERAESTPPLRLEPDAPAVMAERARAQSGPRTRRAKTEPRPADPAQPGVPGRDAVPARDPDPHHALNTEVVEPDPTEWPDPYDRRPDPRDPGSGEELPLGEAPHTPTGATSTSAPHPSQDPEAEPWEGPKRDKVDE
jgi:hypothetical protein